VIPIRDVNPTSRVAVLTIGLIVVNVVVFLFQVQKPDDLSLEGQQAFICEFGLVPEHVTEDPAIPAGGNATCLSLNQEQPRFLGLFSSQFLHGDWLHLVGNMLFLWVFGNNIEDRLGRLRFLPFYLVVGVIAGMVQVLSNPSSDVPVIGASGAVSGILGAYLVLYPRKRVWTVVLPLVFLPFRLPAWIWLLFYLVLQVVFLGNSAISGEGEDGVAYLAHIGGFVAGAALILPFAVARPEPVPRVPPPPTTPGNW
jgi:membrane associated rhomboid family serine protease